MNPNILKYLELFIVGLTTLQASAQRFKDIVEAARDEGRENHR